MKRVAILTHKYIALFELGCAVELFALPRPEFECWYQTDVVTFDDEIQTTSGGLLLQPKRVHHLDDYDMVVIPNWSASDSTVPAEIAESVRALYQRGGRVLSFCSGSFMLAEIGLLNDRQATTHWHYADRFKQKYPNVSYVDDVLYVYDGRLGCSAGSAAGIDLGIEVIRSDYGYEVANQVARRLVLAAHRHGGQSQFVETPVIKTPNQFSVTLDWALSHLDQDIDVNLLAQKANMSRRTFDRKFRASLNQTPKEWLTQQRLELAKRLLETTSDSVERVANSAGFENAMTLRHHFRKYLQLSPSQFRAQFSAQFSSQ
ncbi:helix-turn-helix domain-containing protein [Litoribacillus peritrichatus]